MSRQPIIGITSGPDTEDAVYGHVHRYRLSSDYTRAVEDAGGIPMILPLHTRSVSRLLDVVDALIFSGGADIDPAIFGQDALHAETYGLDPERDSFELELMRAAIAADKPILSICRGIQVMNVALGGTLIQHIPDEVEGALSHRQFHDQIPAHQPAHAVDVTPGSLLEEVYGVSQLEVNSLHHQSIRDVGAGLRVDGISPDGVIEAISLPGAAFALGVQWHPEMMQAGALIQRKPFEALIAAVTAGTLSHA